MTGGHSQRDGGTGSGLIVGGDSLVGSVVGMHCRELGIRIETTSRRPRGQGIFLDLRSPDFTPLDQANYGFAVVCAAVTDMRACEHDPVTTRRVNVESTIELMGRLASKGTHVVFLSSSQVFDGETPAPAESAPTCPKNEYGAQKLAVEQAITDRRLPVAILRVTKVLADRPVGVFKGWLDALVAGKPIQAATDMALSPVTATDVARAAELLAAGRHCGIWHLSARDAVGYFEAARRMAELRGLPISLVRGQPSNESQVPAIFRQRHVTLSSEKIARSLDMPLRNARDVLDNVFTSFAQPAAAP